MGKARAEASEKFCKLYCRPKALLSFWISAVPSVMLTKETKNRHLQRTVQQLITA